MGTKSAPGREKKILSQATAEASTGEAQIRSRIPGHEGGGTGVTSFSSSGLKLKTPSGLLARRKGASKPLQTVLTKSAKGVWEKTTKTGARAENIQQPNTRIELKAASETGHSSYSLSAGKRENLHRSMFAPAASVL